MTAGAYGAVLTMCGMFGSLLGSVLPLQIPRRRPFLVGAGLLMPLTAFGCFVTPAPMVLLPSLVLFGLVSTVFVPVMLTIPMEAPQIGPTRAGVAVSVILAAGNDNLFNKFCQVAACPELAQDARFATRQARVDNRVLVDETLEAPVGSIW